MKFFDEALREILPRLRQIADPVERINATRSAFDEFKRDFPDVVGAMKFFAQIESDAIEEYDNAISAATPTVKAMEEIREILKAEQRED